MKIINQNCALDSNFLFIIEIFKTIIFRSAIVYKKVVSGFLHGLQIVEAFAVRLHHLHHLHCTWLHILCPLLAVGRCIFILIIFLCNYVCRCYPQREYPSHLLLIYSPLLLQPYCATTNCILRYDFMHYQFFPL